MGLYIKHEITQKDIMVDPKVVEFMKLRKTVEMQPSAYYKEIL